MSFQLPAIQMLYQDACRLKPMIKALISGILVSCGISDVAIVSVHSDKTRLKKCMMTMIIIMLMNKSQETMVFRGRQKLTSAMKLRLMVDFKFDALYRYVLIESLQKSG